MARTRANDYREKQRKILDAAATVLARVGTEKASMAEIARESGTSKASLYHYYESKSALIFDIIHTHLSDLEKALNVADQPHLPPSERLRQLVGAVLAEYEDAGAKHTVQLNGKSGLPAEQVSELLTMERQVTNRFALVLQDIDPSLKKKPSLLMPLTMSLFGMLNWTDQWFRAEGPMSRDEYASLVTSLFLHGILKNNT